MLNIQRIASYHCFTITSSRYFVFTMSEIVDDRDCYYLEILPFSCSAERAYIHPSRSKCQSCWIQWCRKSSIWSLEPRESENQAFQPSLGPTQANGRAKIEGLEDGLHGLRQSIGACPVWKRNLHLSCYVRYDGGISAITNYWFYETVWLAHWDISSCIRSSFVTTHVLKK